MNSSELRRMMSRSPWVAPSLGWEIASTLVGCVEKCGFVASRSQVRPSCQEGAGKGAAGVTAAGAALSAQPGTRSLPRCGSRLPRSPDFDRCSGPKLPPQCSDTCSAAKAPCRADSGAACSRRRAPRAAMAESRPTMPCGKPHKWVCAHRDGKRQPGGCLLWSRRTPRLVQAKAGGRLMRLSRTFAAGGLARGGRRSSSRLLGVALAELLNAAGGVEDLLLAGVERVAGRADFDVQVASERRARLEAVPAAAGDGDFVVLGVDFVFHGWVLTFPGRLAAGGSLEKGGSIRQQA